MGKNNESILGHNLVGWFNCLFTHHINPKIKSSCDFLIFNFIPIYTLPRSDVQIDFFFSFTLVHFSMDSLFFPRWIPISFSRIFIFLGGMDHVSQFIEFFQLGKLILCFITVNWCSMQIYSFFLSIWMVDSDNIRRTFSFHIRKKKHKKNIYFKPSLQRNFNRK